MRRRVVAAAAVALVAGAGCSGGSGTGSGGDGHLVVQRVAKVATALMDEPGRADYCSADSLLVITAMGHNRAAGFAARTRLPLNPTRTFVVQRALGAVGTATAAFRLASGSGRLAASGTLRLQLSGTISGDFDVVVGDSAGTTVRFKGKLMHIRVRTLPPAACQDV
jgi:hypothetical protein